MPGRSSVAVGELQVSEFLDALGERTPAPASGAAAAVTGAFAASLVELAARIAKNEAAVTRARALSTRLTQLADEDATAYMAFIETRSEQARRRRLTQRFGNQSLYGRNGRAERWRGLNSN